MNLTGCLKPCHYTVYSLVGEILTGKQNYTSLYLQMAKSTNTVKREILGIALKIFRLFLVLIFHETVMMVLNISWHIIVYPAISLLSELGGALGLFVGFSLLMIWDAIILISYKFLHTGEPH